MVPHYLGLKTITRNLERAFFPIFGIMIGVASIITILSVSAGGKVLIENDLAQIGENRIIVIGENPHETDIRYLKTLEFVRYVEIAPRGILVGLKEGDGLDDLVVTALNRYNMSGKYTLVEESKNYTTAKRIKETLTLFLTTLGVVATVLGGISISNLMASMIQKRKGQIGMLMSVGADSDFIFKMFLTEALILSSLGGILGGVFGIVLSIVLGNTIGIPSVISGTEVLLVMGLAILMGGVFGIFPAKRAAKLNPVVAIKY